MFTTGSKLFLGLSALALAATMMFLWSADEGVLFGLFVLFTFTATLLFLAGTVIVFRDTDGAIAVEAVSAADAEGSTVAPSGVSSSIWPAVSAIGAGLIVLGLITDNRYFVGGIVVLLASIIEWMVASWADRLSSDPGYNRSTRDRLLHPIEFPLAGLLIAGVMVYGFSRIMLSISRNASFAAFGGIAVVVLLSGIIVSARPKIGRRTVGGLLGVGAVAILTGGIVSVVHGERTFSSEHAPAAPLFVSDSANTLAQLTIGEAGFDFSEVQVAKGLTASVLIRNRSAGSATFAINGLYTDAAGKDHGQVFTTEPIKPGAIALLTFKLTRSGHYNYTATLASGNSINGTLTVP